MAIMGPSFEREKMSGGPVEAEVQTWTDEDDQYECIARWICGECGKKARLGLEPTTDYYHYLELRKALPDAKFLDASAATDRIRAVKSRAEIECLKAAAQTTRLRMEEAPSMLVRGMTEKELTRIFGPGAMVQFGLTTASPNAAAGGTALKADDIVVIDAGDRVEGYRSDLTRTFFFGEPSAKMREIYRIVNDAELAGIAAAKPGEPAESVDSAARKIIEQAGYNELFWHRAGHGLGLGFHEIPICAKGSPDILEPGMVLTVEPGIYLPGEFGVRLEDDILITETGCEMLCDRGPLYL
jgi:Xaa-Pro dipeptidase